MAKDFPWKLDQVESNKPRETIKPMLIDKLKEPMLGKGKEKERGRNKREKDETTT